MNQSTIQIHVIVSSAIALVLGGCIWGIGRTNPAPSYPPRAMLEPVAHSGAYGNTPRPIAEPKCNDLRISRAACGTAAMPETARR